MTTPRERLVAVLDAFTALGYRNAAGAAQAVAAALPLAAQSDDAAASIGRVLPADWLAVHSITRGNAGAALARALEREFDRMPDDDISSSPEQQKEAPVVDLVFVTALGLEHQAVRAHLARPHETHSARGTVYTHGTLGAHGPGAAVLQTGQGNAAAAAETERALALFSPRAVMFVGVAGGLKSNPLGTVIAAEHVYDYGHAAEDADRDRGRIKTHPSSYRAVQAAQASARSAEWMARRVEPPGGWPDEVDPTALVKPIAAGSRLVRVSDGHTAQWIADLCNDAAAVEMEGWGFLQAAYAHPGIDAIVIRGLSDRLGDKGSEHDDRWQPAAAANAAAFAVDVALRLLKA